MLPEHRTGLWLPAMLVLVATIVWATCATILDRPQISPDDFRYLRLAEDLRADNTAATDPGRACIVENRWDHLWFVSSDAVVRFWRPTVFASFKFDSWLWGNGNIFGLLLTNILLHGACCLLAALILWRLLGGGLPALSAAVLFAAFSAHAEAIWYIAGRTETLAATGFLLGLLLHLEGRARRPCLCWLALPAFAFALLSKELTIVLPVLLVAHDRWLAPRAGTVSGVLARDRWLWGGYALVALAFLLMRQVVIGSSALELPYFVPPWSEQFPAHLLAQLRGYAGNLLALEPTAPFGKLDRVLAQATVLGWVLTFLAPLTAVLLLLRVRLFWWFALFAVLTWLPTSFVYLSERYVYLPSFALAGVAGLGLRRLAAGHRLWFALGIGIVLWWTAEQAWMLWAKNRWVSHTEREVNAVSRQLMELPAPPRGGSVLFVNFPSEIVHAQFLEDQLRFFYGDPALQVRVLSMLPAGQAPKHVPRVQRTGPRTLRVDAEQGLMARPTVFPWVDFVPDRTFTKARSRMSVTVLEGTGSDCTALHVELVEKVDDLVLLRFVPEADAVWLHDATSIPAGRFERLHL